MKGREKVFEGLKLVENDIFFPAVRSKRGVGEIFSQGEAPELTVKKGCRAFSHQALLKFQRHGAATEGWVKEPLPISSLLTKKNH